MAQVPLLKAAKVIIGDFDTSVLSLGDLLGLQSGTLVNPGISFFGAQVPTGIGQGTVTIGPPLAIPGIGAIPFSLNVLGDSNFIGITNHLGSTNTIGISQFFGLQHKLAADISEGIKVNNAHEACTATSFVADTLNVPSDIICDSIYAGFGSFESVAAPFKKFDIPHPSKEGHRLVHTCLEGPEIGVYYRGRLKKSNIIELPYYWKNLVDEDTISVNLTPHIVYQELFVKKVDTTKIIVGNNSGSLIDCSYVVYAERKDVDKLIVEYEDKK